MHGENVFDLTSLDWHATLDLLPQVKALLDKEYDLDGVTMKWVCL
ncbi:hypothetical protein (plasmid) [Metabacillus dongyingensis]|nr:hypothetical protein [Metabacillus dongyingensis]